MNGYSEEKIALLTSSAAFNRARLSAKRPRATPSPRNTPKPTRYTSKRPLFVSLVPPRPSSSMQSSEKRSAWRKGELDRNHKATNPQKTKRDARG